MDETKSRKGEIVMNTRVISTTLGLLLLGGPAFATAKPADQIQAPRIERIQTAHTEEVQAPRGEEQVQAPRSEEQVQAPRGEEQVQAPRSEEQVQAPRGEGQPQPPRGQKSVQALLSEGQLQMP